MNKVDYIINYIVDYSKINESVWTGGGHSFLGSINEQMCQFYRLRKDTFFISYSYTLILNNIVYSITKSQFNKLFVAAKANLEQKYYKYKEDYAKEQEENLEKLYQEWIN